MSSAGDSHTTECSDCLATTRTPEFNHALCRKHRLCFSSSSYAPELCSICEQNKSWLTNNKSAFKEWSLVLRSFQKNTKPGWFYSSRLKEFFPQNLSDIISDSESHSSRTKLSTSSQKSSSAVSSGKLFTKQEVNNAIKNALQHAMSSLVNPTLDSTPADNSLPLHIDAPSTSGAHMPHTYDNTLVDYASSDEESDFEDSFVNNADPQSASAYFKAYNTPLSSIAYNPTSSVSISSTPSHQIKWKFEDLVPASNEDGHVWFHKNPNMNFVNNTIIIGDKTESVVIHNNNKWFRTVPFRPSSDIFISASSEVEALKRAFETEEFKGTERFGSGSKSFLLPVDSSLNMNNFFAPFSSDSISFVMENLMNADGRSLSSFFKQKSASSNVSVIPSSWNCSHFNVSDWAISSLLRVDLQSSKLKMSKPASVQEKFLLREREARLALIDIMSSILKQYSLLDTFDDSDVSRKDIILGSLQSLIPPARELTISWIKAKIEVRKRFLHSFSGTSTNDLLRSNPWNNSIFCPDTVAEVLQLSKSRVPTEDILGQKPSKRPRTGFSAPRTGFSAIRNTTPTQAPNTVKVHSSAPFRGRNRRSRRGNSRPNKAQRGRGSKPQA